MDQVQDMPILDEAKNTVEIVVHFSENLEDRQRNNLVDALEKEGGIVSAEFCPFTLPSNAGEVRQRPVFISRCAFLLRFYL